MRDLRFRLIRIIAVILVIGLALFSPLLSLPAREGVVSDMNVPPQLRYVKTFDRPRPEVRFERVLKLEDFTGFDPDLATLFEPERKPRSKELAGSGERGFEQIASISGEGRSGGRDGAVVARR